jgi:hypothetical protein
VPHIPQELGVPVQLAPESESPPPDANTESFLVSRFEPHFGQLVPSHRLVRTNISLSLSHFSQ